MDSPEARATSHSPRPRTSAEQVAFLARLAGGLAHEIKNPLSTIAINLALLEEEWGRTGAQRPPAPVELSPREQRSLRRIKTLQREVSRMETILDEFLRFARGAQINRAPKDVSLLVRELLDFVEPENAQAGIRQHAELAVGMPLCMLDETAFKQAVLNLLKNAREAMPSGGELLVRTRREGNWAELSVTDTGVGMSPDALTHCFDEYWSDKRGGTGLGLPTARRIVEEHGGTIHVVSEKERGTSFTIYLPLIVEIARAARVDDATDEREVELERSSPGPEALDDASDGDEEA
ncbi:MAG: two-component sensor histidine kinase [Planctomycetes bacterium]|nr:two-component sensor histidine kinase [Planctomycetota bacterium]